eukprot:11408665-Alexandrium_andersonii.AAC.1
MMPWSERPHMPSGSYSAVNHKRLSIPPPWSGHLPEFEFDEAQRRDVQRAAWYCQWCHTPHSNDRCMKCRGCKRDRFQQQPKPKPWVQKGQWPVAEKGMREQKGPLVRQQVQAGPARAAARPPKELR